MCRHLHDTLSTRVSHYSQWFGVAGDALLRFATFEEQVCQRGALAFGGLLRPPPSHPPLSLQGALNAYLSFVGHFPGAIATLRHWMHGRPDFRDFLTRCRQDPRCDGLDMAAFMLTPVQRLPRLILLVRELMSTTTNTHPDSAMYPAVLAALKSCTDRINASLKSVWTLGLGLLRCLVRVCFLISNPHLKSSNPHRAARCRLPQKTLSAQAAVWW